ncbi:MAG TPA: fasciclin domain-containing protein [Allosphingosinicella sp.]
MKRALIAAAALLAAACQQDGGGNAASADAGTNASGPGAAAKGEPAKTNILQTLSESADHKTLANAVQAAGLTETLSGAQPYTLFAPDEAAFRKLPAGTANGLLAPDAKGQLVALLTGHIVPGVVTAADLSRAIDRGNGKAELATVGGSNLTFSRSGDAIVITDAAGGQARVARADLLQSNGVVHSIDGVLRSR